MRIEQDYFHDHVSYISEERANRPQETKGAEEKQDHDIHTCYFCPGNEHMTPPEIGRTVDENGSWKIRWFPNKYPALSIEESDAYGYHEVIVETSNPEKQLWDFSPYELSEVFEVYKRRVSEIAQDKKIQYISVFKNHGFEAGASLAHSHTQLMASSVFPSKIERERSYMKTQGACTYCEIIKNLPASLKIAENDDFMLFCPRAPRFAMEAWIVAKEHQGNFLSFSPEKCLSITDILDVILKKLKTLSAPYCYYFSFLPNASDMHFHLEILPRLHKWAGFELASGDYIIPTPPESATIFYREKQQ